MTPPLPFHVYLCPTIILSNKPLRLFQKREHDTPCHPERRAPSLLLLLQAQVDRKPVPRLFRCRNGMVSDCSGILAVHSVHRNSHLHHVEATNNDDSTPGTNTSKLMSRRPPRRGHVLRHEKSWFVLRMIVAKGMTPQKLPLATTYPLEDGPNTQRHSTCDASSGRGAKVA